MSTRMGLCLMVCLVLLVAGCSGPLSPASPSPAGDPDAEETAVYAAIVRKRFFSTGIERLVIDAETSTGHSSSSLGETLDYVKQSLPHLLDDTLEDFESRNQGARTLRADLQLGKPYVLVTQDEMSAIFADRTGGWDAFYAKYPNSQGSITLSRVGFNRAMDQALVYVGHQQDWTAGIGYYYLLAKKDGAWIIEAEIMVWVS
jgi:hypothetical protein